MRQDRILRGIVSAIQREYTTPAVMQRLREELVRQVKQQPDSSDSARRASRIQNRIEALDQKIAKAQRRLALVDDDLCADVSNALRMLKAERTTLASELASAGKSQRGRILEAGEHVDKAMDLFNRLAEAFGRADSEKVRDFLHTAIDHVDLTVDKRQQGERFRYDFRKGVIHFAGSQAIGATMTTPIRCPVCHPGPAGRREQLQS